MRCFSTACLNLLSKLSMVMVREHEQEQDQKSWLVTTRKESADARLMGELNRSIVLNFIRQERSISRAEIAQRTNLSRSAVSNIISSLLREGIVQESGIGESKGGRRPIMVNFNHNAGYAVGIDVGANHILAIATDLDGNIVLKNSSSFSIDIGPERALPIILTKIQDLLASPEINPQRVVGMGVGVPGPLDYTTGKVIAPPIMPGWDNFPLRDFLARNFSMPVLIENDANLGAAAERWCGAGTGYDHLAYVKIGTGIGCGLVFEGKIYRGQRGSAGEIGHITITRDGPPCRCGSYGCLESMAASPAIIMRARLAIEAGRSTSITDYANPGELELLHIEQAAQNGDMLAQELINDAGRYIGIALANLINLFNPGVIVLGGGVVSLGELLLEPIRETVKIRSLVARYQDTHIVMGQLGREAVALGAATLALQEVFQGPKLALTN